jgi:hypothetical protein
VEGDDLFWQFAPRACRLLRESGWLDLDAVFEVLEVLRYGERGSAALGLRCSGVRFDPWEKYRYPLLAPGLRAVAAQMLRSRAGMEVVREACRRFEQAWLERL